MAERQISTAERALNFANGTRQNMHMLVSQQTSTAGDTLQFPLPKARLLSKLIINVNVICKITHATSTELPMSLDPSIPFKTLRRISLDLNNGFSPYNISGLQASIYGRTLRFGDLYRVGDDNNNTFCTVPEQKLKAAPNGAKNTFSYTLELPVTLNDREPVGLILLQSPETNVTLSCDVAMPGEIIPKGLEGYTFEFENIKMEVMTETFSLPSMADAFPDLSVLKLVHGRQDVFLENENVIKLSPGNIYRKLILRFVDDDGYAISESNLSNLELVFNQADINYSISASMLRRYNLLQYGFSMPEGVYIFDFASMQGLVNMSGTRDLIDTEKLSEFWLRFSAGKSGKIDIVSELLARVKSS